MNEEIRNNEELNAVVKEENLEDVNGGVAKCGHRVTCSYCGWVYRIPFLPSGTYYCEKCKGPFKI